MKLTIETKKSEDDRTVVFIRAGVGEPNIYVEGAAKPERAMRNALNTYFEVTLFRAQNAELCKAVEALEVSGSPLLVRFDSISCDIKIRKDSEYGATIAKIDIESHTVDFDDVDDLAGLRETLAEFGYEEASV